MKVLGIRFCSVTSKAEELAEFLGKGLGLPQERIEGTDDSEGFAGAIFPAAESWIEIWPVSAEMPSGIMLQIVVDDADAWAAEARGNGLDPKGPIDAHGERIYYLRAPGGLDVSFQSKLAGETSG